jgi:hypothetical protein
MKLMAMVLMPRAISKNGGLGSSPSSNLIVSNTRMSVSLATCVETQQFLHKLEQTQHLVTKLDQTMGLAMD